MTGQDWLVFLTGVTGTVGFALLFSLHGRQIPVTALGGALTCLCWLLSLRFGMKPFFAILLASFLGSGYSTVVSRLLKTPKTVFLLSVMISLVPGKGLYQTMRLAVDANWGESFSCAISTLSDMLGIATGMLLALILEKSVNQISRRRRKTGG